MVREGANDNVNRRTELSPDEKLLLPQVQGALRAVQLVLEGKRWERRPDDTERKELEEYGRHLIVIGRHMKTKPPKRTPEEDVAKIVNGARELLTQFIPAEELKEFNLGASE